MANYMYVRYYFSLVEPPGGGTRVRRVSPRLQGAEVPPSRGAVRAANEVPGEEPRSGTERQVNQRPHHEQNEEKESRDE